MPSAVRSYLTTGLALMGAGVVTATQIAPPLQQAETRVMHAAVTLAAAVGNGLPCSGYNTYGCDLNAPQTYTPLVPNQSGSPANIAANILNAAISIPRAVIDAVNELSYALEVTGNWWVYGPNNVLGSDPADPPKYTALVDLLIPFKPVSNAVGNQVSWWAKANLPMGAGCTATVGPLCKDLNSVLATMFLAPIWKLAAGYQFPTVINPVSDAEGTVGEEIPGSVGTEVAWSGAYVKLNVFDPAIALFNYLTADPSTNTPKPIAPGEVAATLDRLRKALKLDFYPFVQGSFLLKGWPYTALTPLFKPFIGVLCPDCDPLNPGVLPKPTPPSAATTPVSEEAPEDSAKSVASSVDAGPKTEAVDAGPKTEAVDAGSKAEAVDAGSKAEAADAVEPVSAKPETAPAEQGKAADASAAAVDATDSAPAVDADQDVAEPTATKKADGADTASSAPVGKTTRGGHRGRTPVAAGAAAGNSGTERGRSSASAE